MNLPFGFGNLDFSDWVRGLVSAFVSGGASAVSSGMVVSNNDPKDYAIGTHKFYVLVWTVFATAGLLNAVAFLRTKPVPEAKQESKSVAATSGQ